MTLRLPREPLSLATTFFVVCAASACLPFESSIDAGVSYSTQSTPWAADTECVEEGVRDTAYELLNTDTFTVVANGGSNPIPPDAWDDYNPSGSWKKNSTRNLLFTDQCFSQSPYTPFGCTGDACETVAQVDDYTWVELSQILSIDCIPKGDACNPGGLGPGELAFIVTRKCHSLTFEGDAYFLNGPNGERAVMHAFGDSGAPTTDVELPEGWSLSVETLSEPLVTYPFGDEGDCYYNVIRDDLEQSYHQISYGQATYP